ncbi:MAG TPA: hypothetical protein P5056_01935 [Candidatus Paceibacterota bacterium]|nr:hypothetical protein [Candidatus Paceibacterota bacterium]
MNRLSLGKVELSRVVSRVKLQYSISDNFENEQDESDALKISDLIEEDKKASEVCVMLSFFAGFVVFLSVVSLGTLVTAQFYLLLGVAMGILTGFAFYYLYSFFSGKSKLDIFLGADNRKKKIADKVKILRAELGL